MTPAHGTLVGEPIPYKDVDSLNSLFIGQVRLSDGSLRSCLLKNLERVELVNELISNLIANRLNLPVPRAVLTFVPDQFSDKGQFDKAPKISGGCLVFSSVDVQTPNLVQRFSSTHPLGQEIIRQALTSWGQRGGLYGFDTWVANVDRHQGNLLFGHKNEVWLIDHGRCFTKEDWTPSDLKPNVTYQNKLRLWYTRMMDTPLRLQTIQNLQTVQIEIAKLDLQALLVDSFAVDLTNDQEQKALLEFLSGRTGRVAADGAAALQP